MTKTRIGLVVVTAVFIGALVCGCQEEQASQAAPGVSDVKESRLIGAENVHLKGQIETLKKQIETLQGQIEQQEKQRQGTQFEQEKQRQIAQLEQARQADLKACEDKSIEMLAAQAENMQGLTAEIAALKAELEKIKGTNKAKK